MTATGPDHGAVPSEIWDELLISFAAKASPRSVPRPARSRSHQSYSGYHRSPGRSTAYSTWKPISPIRGCHPRRKPLQHSCGCCSTSWTTAPEHQPQSTRRPREEWPPNGTSADLTWKSNAALMERASTTSRQGTSRNTRARRTRTSTGSNCTSACCRNGPNRLP